MEEKNPAVVKHSVSVEDGYISSSNENVDKSIPLRYRGSHADRQDMLTLGKRQELRVGRAHVNCCEIY